MGGFEVLFPILSGAMGAFGQIQAGRAQAAQAEAEAQAARLNAELAAVNEDISRSDAKVAQAQAEEEAQRAIGRQRAALAQGGLLYSATGESLLNESRRNADDQQLAISRQAELEGLNYKIQRQNALNSAGVLKANAKASRTGAYLGAGGSLLDGAAKGYGYYKSYGSDV